MASAFHQVAEKRYGRHLVAVLEHLDENNPHLHFYAIEPKGLT